MNEQLTEGDESEGQENNALHEEQESKADNALHEVRVLALNDRRIRNDVLGALKTACSVGAIDSDKELLVERWELYELNYLKRAKKTYCTRGPLCCGSPLCL
jgi:hypothetical protein